MGSSSSLIPIHLAVVVLESLLYGMFVTLVGVSFYIRISRYAEDPRGYQRVWCNPVVLCTAAIFITCTAHWILTIDRFFRIFLGSESPTVLLRCYSRSSDVTQEDDSALSMITMCIGEAIVIHRLWVLWNRKFCVVALPVLLWIILIAVGTASIVALYTGVYYLHPMVTAYWVLSAVTNIYCTALIAWRIWRARRESTSKIPMSVIIVIIESAAFLTVWTVFYAATHETSCELLFVATGLAPSIIGLSNMLIHIRVGLHWSREEDTETGIVMTSEASIFALSLSPVATPSVPEEGDSISLKTSTLDKPPMR